MIQNRWRSKVLWASLIAQVVSILLLTGVVSTGQADMINQVAAMLLQIGVIVGVINNPTDKEHW
mgnify:CR=1 FL=1